MAICKPDQLTNISTLAAHHTCQITVIQYDLHLGDLNVLSLPFCSNSTKIATFPCSLSRWRLTHLSGISPFIQHPSLFQGVVMCLRSRMRGLCDPTQEEGTGEIGNQQKIYTHPWTFPHYCTNIINLTSLTASLMRLLVIHL